MKNKTMRVAALLLALTLMTSCFVGGTFAKYTSGDQGSDMARVAKWGVEVEAESFKMFAEHYATTDNTYTGEWSVEASDSDVDNLLAPGTNGQFANISITGTPEVAVKVEIEADVKVEGDWTDDEGKYYCPVIVTVGTTDICGLDYASAGDFASAIASALTTQSNVYGPNEPLGDTYNGSNLDLAWRWGFETGDHDCNTTLDHVAGDQNDIRDTDLGDKATAGDLKLSIKVIITVTQVD